MIEVKIDANSLKIYLDQVDAKILSMVRDEIDVQASLMADYMRASRMAGPTGTSTISIRTGTLVRSLRPVKGVINPDGGVIGGLQVGATVPYARVHINRVPGSTTIQRKGKLLAIPIGPALTKGKNVRRPSPQTYGKQLFPITSKKGNKLLVMKQSGGKKGKGKGGLIPYFILKESVRIPTRIDPQQILESRVTTIMAGIRRAISLATGA